MKKTTRKTIVKIDVLVRFELKDYPGVIIDAFGYVWKTPAPTKDGRVIRLRQLKPFYHIKYNAYLFNQRIISEKVFLANKTAVSYKRRFVIDAEKVPDEAKHMIAGAVEAKDRKYLNP